MSVIHDMTEKASHWHEPPKITIDYWYSWMPEDDWFCANGERR